MEKGKETKGRKGGGKHLKLIYGYYEIACSDADSN